MTKIGRNEKCPCGSGKKHKHCHGSATHLRQHHSEMAHIRQRSEAAQVQRQRQQGFGKPIISTLINNGERLVVVKNRLMRSKGWNTFHDFLYDYIKTALGQEWGSVELTKPAEERHPILNWSQKVNAHLKAFRTEPGKISFAPITGVVAAYLHLAYDLYALDHNAELQQKLLARLRLHDNNFEGALYEVFVAAMLIRAGFEIEFENEDDRSSRHCEFTATFIKTGRKFSVEAKHRAGTRLRMGHLLNDALSKNANYPRIVFIDLNIPDDGSEELGPSKMNLAIRKLRAFEGKLNKGQPLPQAYLIVTNTPWQHHMDSTSFRCIADIDGFQIPDFKLNVSLTLRDAIDARAHHIELHELIQSIKDHTVEIPSTFDSEIPEFAFNANMNESMPRLIIGQNYLIPDENGTERSVILTNALVFDAMQQVICFFKLDNGQTVINSRQLSDLELAAWRRHPDTFFGEVGQRTSGIATPLELYDILFNNYRDIPKERLLEFLADAPDFSELAKLDQPRLASIYAERAVNGIYAIEK